MALMAENRHLIKMNEDLSAQLESYSELVRQQTAQGLMHVQQQ